MTRAFPTLPPEAGMAVLETLVLPEWLDHNGHMNVAAYLIAFDRGCCAFCTRAGIGPDRIEATGHTVFVGQANLAYRREVHRADRLCVAARIRGRTHDRMQLYLSLYRAKDDAAELVAACEQLAVAVRLDTRRPAPFPVDVAAWLDRLRAAEATMPPPRLTIGQVNLTPRPAKAVQ